MKAGIGSCNGTFGELVQGVIQNQPFLITLPVQALQSNALFIPNPTDTVITSIQGKQKAKTACRKLLQHFDIDGGGHLYIQSNIPTGKGMASSSADITAALRAVSESYSLPVTKELISSIAGEIEPTDGVMYDGAVAYDHVNGRLLESFGSLPPFVLIGFDTGGVIDTVQFHKKMKSYREGQKAEFERAYDLVKKGIEQQNLACLCQAATISARINQTVLPKPYFNELENLAMQYHGGVVTAHSGTVVGLLLNAQMSGIQHVIAQIKQQFQVMKRLAVLHYS